MRILWAKISSEELLELYGYEPYEGQTVKESWAQLTHNWTPANSRELGHLRQLMLTIHQDLCPDDKRWITN